MESTTWEKTSQSLGKIKVGQKQFVIFNAVAELPTILKMNASCGCTKPEFDKTHNRIVATFSPGAVPKHLASQGFYATTKSITIYYDNGTTDVLSFTATITN